MEKIEGQLGNYITNKKQPFKRGKFGGIWLGYRESDNLQVSIKKIPKQTSSSQHIIMEKICQIKHPNLSETIEYISNEKGFFLIRNYYPGTDLKTIIKKKSKFKNINNNFYIKAFTYLLDAINELHKYNIIHRDIKPSNIIFRHTNEESPNNWKPNNIILTDFEQATIFPLIPNQRAPFALIYSPPEQLLNKSELLNPTCDLFSIAISLYEIIAKKPPYEDCNAEILLNLQLTYPLKKPANMSDSLFEIIQKAAYKERFPIPPKRLSSSVINEILKKGINERFQNAMEFKQRLMELPFEENNQKKQSLLSQLFSK
ncbi:MAG: protein kinase [Marinilabiliaceae bacterium]|nr:protein kinase [Marinilabiliaceae bacterium]